jgi:hypothetical protein
LNRKRSVARQDATSLGSYKPLARSDDLIVEELGDEVLVYDQTTNQAHSLGAAAASVWRACDGKTDADALGIEVGLEHETAARALDELRECNLLDAGAVTGSGITRRDMSVKAAKLGGAVAAVPLIVSLAAPLPAAAGTPSIEFCTSGGTSFACGIDCMVRNCCCCCQTTGGVALTNVGTACGTGGATKCCLPTAQCDAGFFGSTGHCSDTADCP